MVELSFSGLFTLLGLLACGPVVYGAQGLYRKLTGKANAEGEGSGSEVTPTMLSVTATGQLEGQVAEQHDRHSFHSTEYVFALIGYAIGLANVWRFPYMIAQNGGAAALIAYIVCAVFVAVPLFLYELIVGQHVRLSTIRCYDAIRPRWKSLGLASAMMSFIVLTYYGTLVAYTLPYIFHSLETPLPWIEQGAESFWMENVLNRWPDFSKAQGPGPIQWNLALSLTVFWAITYWSVAFGKKFLAKITYVTVLLPILLTAILVARSVVLPGAWDGISFYIVKFEAKKLLDTHVWAAACSQIIFSLSPAFGTAITYSSYAQPKEDVYRACLIVSISNSAFSIFAGFATFSLVGHMAKLEGVAVEDIATRSGTGLAFITIAEAMQYFGPLANAFSVLFFFMLFILGLNSVYAWLETIASYVHDYILEKNWKKQPAAIVNGGLALLMLTCGMIYTTRLGNAALDVVDHFVGSIFLLLVAFAEAIMLNLDFGWQRLEYALMKATYGNPESPKGRTLFPKWMCRLDLHVTIPLVSGLLGVYFLVSETNKQYGGYPFSLVIWGWILLGGLVLIASYSVITNRHAPGSLKPFNMADIPFDEGKTMVEYNPGEVEAPSISVTPTSEASSTPTQLSGGL